MARVSKPIVLVGMMGAGKSTVGKILAERLRTPFIDLDEAIERTGGRSIPEVFEAEGEAGFREMEFRALKGLLTAGGAVIAVGGGAFAEDRTRAHLNNRATTVWLKEEAKTMFERAKSEGGRPLLGTFDDFAARLKAREPYYAEADFTVDIEGRSPQKAAEMILKVLSQ